MFLEVFMAKKDSTKDFFQNNQIGLILCFYGMALFALLVVNGYEQLAVDYVQVLTNFFVILSVAFIGYQAYLAKNDYKEKNRRASIEKAIDMSKFYADNILSNFAYINTIYKNAGMRDIIEKIELVDMVLFTADELKSILSSEDIDKYNAIFDNIPTSILLSARQHLNGTNMVHVFDDMIQFETEVNPRIKIAISANCQKEFDSILFSTMNYLEYFAMSFNDEIADETTVYQSLHQTFITLVKINYFFIAERNINEHDKYYTHIIDLFTTWKAKYFEDRQEEKCKEEEIEFIKVKAELDQEAIRLKAKEEAERKAKEKTSISKRTKNKK